MLFDTLSPEQASAAIAMIVVAGPIYALHGWFAGRGLHGETEAALDERRSAIRALYLGRHRSIARGIALAVRPRGRGRRSPRR